ncbi:MAG: AraC family transcriptional regulator [Candidatus Omnitrophica bacterium]|nr:AraC family transcriptional regulator [Candidatus Omnitrophota bacterium]
MALNPLALIASHPTGLAELYWLVDAAESRQPLNDLRPIWVRSGIHQLGSTKPHPERHPYCEFGIILEGQAISFIKGEKAERLPGDLLLAGPGVPHWAIITKYPTRFITVYFLPSVLIELGPENDGPRLLHRFIARQPLRGHMVRPSPELRDKLVGLFEAMVREFEGQRFGREIKLRILLMEQLVEFLRWEQQEGRDFATVDLAVDWKVIDAALEYLRNHYTEPIYAQNLARAAGVSESRLKVLFKNAFGIPWCKYLQSYRVHRAAALFSESRCSVSEAAFAVGFESLSHFNAVFRSLMGRTPSDFANQLRLKTPFGLEDCRNRQIELGDTKSAKFKR